MLKIFRKVKKFIERRVDRLAYKAVINFNSEVEEIVNKTLANEEIEEIVVQAVERVIFSLIRQYWLVMLILVVVLLLIQSFFLSFTLSILLKK